MPLADGAASRPATLDLHGHGGWDVGDLGRRVSHDCDAGALGSVDALEAEAHGRHKARGPGSVDVLVMPQPKLRCPVPLTVRGTQALVSFAPLAFKLFCAARQNAVLRRSSF